MQKFEKETLQGMTLQELRLIAKENEIKKVSSYTKEELIDVVLSKLQEVKEEPKEDNYSNLEIKGGILEPVGNDYGFLRTVNYDNSVDDIYIAAAQIRKFNLRKGDFVEGYIRKHEENKSSALVRLTKINGINVEEVKNRPVFENLTPIYPREKIILSGKGSNSLSCRVIDLLSPIGKGQRGMIVAPPKTGKTTLLKDIANAITLNNENIYLIVLLIDERPEEVTDIMRSVKGDVVYSTFDENPEHHIKVSELVLARAKRLVEMKKDVVILMDSLTRLTRANNVTINPTGRTLSGGMDPGAFGQPKKLFGSARALEEGGSLTILATTLIDTGSRMDDLVFEEFKGTGNMEVHLNRELAEKRIFPAIDILKSGTRKEELLLDPDDLKANYMLRRLFSDCTADKATEQLLEMLEKTETNEEFSKKLPDWIKIMKS